MKDKDSAELTVNEHTVTQIRPLTESAFILRFTRGNMRFRAGQHIIVGRKGEMDQREYSVYSGENDDYIEILVKEVKDGNISVKLKKCKPGDLLNVNGPFGSFGTEPFDRYSRKHVFVATGTGISPFHSMVRSYPGMNYTLVHGVRSGNEAYDRKEYEADRYILCTSKESNNTAREKRVTMFLSKSKLAPDMLFYLCGNGNMIYEASRILKDKGIPAENIFTEIYF